MDWASEGRVVEMVERWFEEAIIDLCDRFESACSDIRRECDVWESD